MTSHGLVNHHNYDHAPSRRKCKSHPAYECSRPRPLEMASESASGRAPISETGARCGPETR
jgi:hypothetical protein